jgi:hypothetical protein
MATGYVENVFVNSPTLLDAKQGPFSSPEEAQRLVPIEARSIGLFHFIDTGSGAKLYWYKNGIEDPDLILFSGNNSVLVFDVKDPSVPPNPGETFFPPEGETDVIYVDKSTSSSYYWDAAAAPPAYVLTGSGVGSVEIYPKYESGGPSDVPGVDYFPTIGVVNVIYIANDTDFSYYWDPNANNKAGGYIKIIGNQGKSAYEIWLELGNFGSEQDFIDSLKGEPGDGITINGLNYVGDWEVLTVTPYNFLEGDVVVYQGSSYVRIFPGEDTSTSPPPDISPNWGLLTSKGAEGEVGPPGPDGAQGPPGPQGNPGAIGPAGLIWRGEWSSSTVYAPNDAVGFGGASYFCVTAVGPSANDPTVDTVNWALLANIGAQGVQGPAGPAGAIGPAGPQGPQGAAGVLYVTITDNQDGPISIAPGDTATFNVVNGGRVLEGGIVYIDEVGYFTVQNVSGNTISVINDFSENTLTIPDAGIGEFRTVIITGPEGPIGPQGDPGTILIKGNIPTSADLVDIVDPDFGDVWITQDDFHGWVWTEEGWVDLGPFQGPPGDDAVWNFTEAYDPGAAYAIGDIVTYEGETWYRLDANGGNVGDIPQEGTIWTKLAAKGADGAGAQDLQEVTDQGNTTTNDIALLDTAKVTFDNGAKLQKGTTNAGALGGIALKCSVDYELKWEAGRLYVMQQDGFEIREVRYTLTATPTVNDDDTKGFVVGSRWILDNGETWVCSDANTGAALWNIEVTGGGISYYTASGTNTYITGAISNPSEGDTYLINFTSPNSGASTLDGITLVNTKTQSNLVSGDIRTNETHLVVYDSSVFQVLTVGPNSSLNPSGGGGGGSGAIVDMGDRMDGLELVDMGSRI